MFTNGERCVVHNRGCVDVFTGCGGDVSKMGQICVHGGGGGGGGQVPACLHSCVEGEGGRGQGVAEILELAKDPFDVGHDFQLSPLSLCSCCFPKNYSCL